MKINSRLLSAIVCVAMLVFQTAPCEESSFSSEELGRMLWQKLEEHNPSINLEEVIQGMKKKSGIAAEKKRTKDPIDLFLQENKQQTAIVEILPGQLQIEILQEGGGLTVKEHSRPLIHFTAKYLDGSLFGSTENQIEPIELPLDEMIPGFKQGVLGMREGEKRRLFIHPDLAYGKKDGSANDILVFDVTVVQLQKDVPVDTYCYSYYGEQTVPSIEAFYEQLDCEETPLSLSPLMIEREEEVVAFEKTHHLNRKNAPVECSFIEEPSTRSQNLISLLFQEEEEEPLARSENNVFEETDPFSYITSDRAHEIEKITSAGATSFDPWTSLYTKEYQASYLVSDDLFTDLGEPANREKALLALFYDGETREPSEIVVQDEPSEDDFFSIYSKSTSFAKADSDEQCLERLFFRPVDEPMTFEKVNLTSLAKEDTAVPPLSLPVNIYEDDQVASALLPEPRTNNPLAGARGYR